MSEIYIDDKRRTFKTMTFSNYKKSEVIKNLIQSIYYGKIEESFFWTCELLCTNLIIDIWNVYFLMMSKYIHVYNPKLPLYIHKKFEDFKQIVIRYGDDFQLRNDKEIRFLFCSIIFVIFFQGIKFTDLFVLSLKYSKT